MIPMMIANMPCGARCRSAINAQGPSLPIVTACATSARTTVGEAFRAVKAGHWPTPSIVGGTEASHAVASAVAALHQLHGAHQEPRPRHRLPPV